jgi:hypothetical protein
MRRPARTAALPMAAVSTAAAAALLPSLGATAVGAAPACEVSYSVANQ